MMVRFAVMEKGTAEATRWNERNVFKSLPSGEVTWCGYFSSPESGKARINELLVTEPGEYLLHNHRSGQKSLFKAGQPVLGSTSPEVS